MRSLRIQVNIYPIEMEADAGGEIPSLAVECSHCKHFVEVYGRSKASIKRGCVMLREQCKIARNYYAYDGEVIPDDN